MNWWVAYAPRGKEFAAQRALTGLGIEAHVPRCVEAKRLPTERRPQPVTRPYLSRLVFIHGTDAQWHATRAVDEIGPTTLWIGERVAERQLQPFLRRIEGDYQQRMAAIEAGERVQEYDAGDVVELLGGPLAGRLATFCRIVERANELYPKLQVEAELLGRVTTMEVDPVNVRKAR